MRIQGTWVADSEVERIVSFWRNAVPPESHKPEERGAKAEERGAKADSHAPASLPPQPGGLEGPGEYLSDDEQDELLPEAIKLVQQHRRASASLLQRRLRIGYSKAAQLIDLLEQQGYVGPAEEGRSREVLRGDDDL